jgi:CHAT domain-containing protein
MKTPPPSDPHSSWVSDLAKRGDWAALVRYWLVYGFHSPAIEAAIELVRHRVQNGRLWNALTGYLEQVRANPMEFQELPSELSMLPDQAGQSTIQLILLFPRLAACQLISQVPLDSRERFGRMGIEAAERSVQIAVLLQDPATEAFCRKLAAAGHSARREWTAAMSHQTRVLEIYRRLTEVRPFIHKPLTAQALSNLANMLAALGKPNEALALAQEAVQHYQELTDHSRADFLPSLAKSINSLAIRLIATGRREEALAQAQEVVRIHRELTAQNRATFLPGLAGALNNLANMLGFMGRYNEALPLAQEAAQIYQELTVQNRAAFLPDFARSLLNLASTMGAAGQRDDALVPAKKAVEIFRELITQDRAAFLLDLAAALNNLANRLSTLGLREQALARAQEAVELYEELAAQDRATFLPDLAMSLNNLSSMLSALGRREAALAPAEGAVGLYRELANQNGPTFLSDFAMSLNNLANALTDLGRRQDALVCARESVGVYRELAAQNRAAFLPDLARSLNTLSNILGALNLREDALARAQEAMEMRRELTTQNRVAFLPDLATSLNNVANRLSDLGRREEALARALEAVEIRRGLAAQNRVAFLGELAGALNNLANRFDDLGQRGDARKCGEEATELCDEIGRLFPTALLEERQRCWANLGRLLRAEDSRARLPDYPEALRALRHARECAEQFRQLFHDPVQRERAQTESLHVYEMLVETCVDVAALTSKPKEKLEALQEAVETAEASRARQLMDLLADEELIPATLPSDKAAAFRELRRHLHQARLELHEEELRQLTAGNKPLEPNETNRISLTGSNRDPGGFQFHGRPDSAEKVLAKSRSRVAALEAEQKRMLEILHEDDPEYDPDHPVRTASCQEIQKLLPVDKPTVVVQYALDRIGGLALLVTREAILPVRLPGCNDREAWELGRSWLLSYYSDSLGSAQELPAERERQVGVLTNSCSQRLMRGRSPLWESRLPEMLRRVSEVALWPVWAELHRHDLLPREPGGVRLVLSPHRALHLFPMHACRLPADGGGHYLGQQFEVCYTPSLSMLRRCVRRQRAAGGKILLTGNPTKDLPFSEVETEALCRRYPESVVLLHGNVKRQRVLELAAHTRRWNYSGHAYFNVKTPLDSALLLVGREPQDVGEWLTLRHVFRELNLPCNELTVLNGCEGALLLPQPADDNVSLSTGMLYAGARCVISTLWVVSDLSSALLSERLHIELEKGKCAAAALREAQRWLREEIRSGVELRDRWLPPLLALLKDDELESVCRNEAENYALSHRDRPPFESPAHWAPFVASGLAWSA